MTILFDKKPYIFNQNYMYVLVGHKKSIQQWYNFVSQPYLRWGEGPPTSFSSVTSTNIRISPPKLSDF